MEKHSSERQTEMACDITPRSEEQIGWLSFWGNLGLAAFKMLIGILGYSRLLIADSLQSSASAVMSTVTLVGIRLSRRSVDRRYPYGHGKMEFVVSAIAGLVISIVAVFLLVSSLSSIRTRYIAQPHLIGLLTAAISIIGNRLMYRYISCHGERLKNPSILLSAKNNRIGVYSSVAVLDGIVGAMLRIYFLEQLASVVVSALVLVTNIRLMSRAIDGIMDKSSSADLIENIRHIIASVEGVQGVPAVKSRRIGQKIWVDLEVQVEAQSTVADASKTAERISKLIMEGIGYVQHVTVDLKPA
jgi:cation diffusion facilitator family transporter